MTSGVKVTGLAELRRELKKLDNAQQLSDDLRDANKAVAELVVDKSKLTAAGVSRLARAAAESLRPSRTVNRAQVLIGSSAIPFALGAEFGSFKYTQFATWRGNGEDAGYFMWPTIRQYNAEIVELYGDALDKITGKAFPD